MIFQHQNRTISDFQTFNILSVFIFLYLNDIKKREKESNDTLESKQNYLRFNYIISSTFYQYLYFRISTTEKMSDEN